MNAKFKKQKIELVIITRISHMGDVEGQITFEQDLQDFQDKTIIKFNDHPPLKVGEKILARITEDCDLETNLPVLIGKFIRKINGAPEKIIGVYKNGVSGKILIPTEKRNKGRYQVEKNIINALDGELVEAQIKNPRKRLAAPSVDIIRSLGDPTQIKLASTIAIYEHGIPNEFSKQVNQNARQRANITVENPTDLTDLPFISIDPSDARDHDDAIYAMEDPENSGGYIIWIAIADVAKYILQDSELDSEALKRGNSTYFPDLVVPMIPDVLSGNICSLKEGKVRAALVVKIYLNRMGQKTAHDFHRCIIKNEIACSYDEAQSILDNTSGNKTNTKLKKLLMPIHAAYKLIEKKSHDRQPLDLELVEQEILFDATGKVKTVKSKTQFEAHRIIEEYMILANICATETIQENKLSFLYRIHEPPTFEKILNLKTVAKSLGVNLNVGAKITPNDLNILLKKAKQQNCSDLINLVILRSMNQAHYSPVNQGHFGLNLSCYSHFTSPIRRYSDLLIHRALIHIHNWDNNSILKNQIDLIKIAEHLSKTERRSMLAERDTKDRYLATFLSDKIDAEFSAQINGLSKSGIFVRLEETGADGLIPLSSIGGERFNLNTQKNKLIGRSSKISFNIGANVSVKLKEANPISGGLIFQLTEYENKTFKISKKATQRVKSHRKKTDKFKY